MTPGSALELRYRLRMLTRKHQLAPEPCIVPPVAPVSAPVILEGIAATCDLDLDRMQLSARACEPLPDCRNVRLLLKHDPTKIVGTVQELRYDSVGDLRVRVRAEHPEARCLNAFSVGLKILECELRDADNANFHGVLKRVEVFEISLTDKPSNPHALVQTRVPACFSDINAHAISAMNCVGKLIELMQREIRHA